MTAISLVVCILGTVSYTHLRAHETRARRVREFQESNDTPVIGMYEGAFLRCHDDRYELLGNKAAVIRKGEETVTHEPGTVLDGELRLS